MSGFLLFCCNCKRVIGYVHWHDFFVLKDVRPLYVVPIEQKVIGGAQHMYFRLLDHGPQKRKCEVDILCEPPFKRFKFDNTRSVIVMRAHVENEEPLESPPFVEPQVADEIYYDSETDSVPELDYYESGESNFDPEFVSEFGFDQGVSTSDSHAFMDEDLRMNQSGSRVVTHLYWVSSPILYIETQDEIQPRKFVVERKKIFPILIFCTCVFVM